jgi:hypothetical protein
MPYNTNQGKITIKEYGRHIQLLILYTKTLEDRTQRTLHANNIIELMALLFPNSKTVEDFRHKLWDHLFLIAEYDLDVDCPYPLPIREIKEMRPAKLKYPKAKLNYRHYGKNVEILIAKALKETDKDKQTDFAQGIATVMKMTYRSFNRENVTDDVIKEDLSMMSNYNLQISHEVDIEQGPMRNIDNGETPIRRRQFGRDNRGGVNNRNNRNNNNRNNNTNNNNSNNRNSNNRNSNNNRNNNNRRFNDNRSNLV